MAEVNGCDYCLRTDQNGLCSHERRIIAECTLSAAPMTYFGNLWRLARGLAERGMITQTASAKFTIDADTGGGASAEGGAAATAAREAAADVSAEGEAS